MKEISTPDNLQVLFEDNHIIVVNKRPSDIVQGDKTGDTPLSEVVKVFLKKKYNKPGNVFLGVVHRLDRPVSGIVVFAKTGKALSRLNNAFRDKQVQKTYWAVVKQPPPNNSGTLIGYLKKDQKNNRSKSYEKEIQGAKRAELHYRLLSKSDQYCLLEVNPITGRHHQIRVQLAHMGCPIKGDLKYGFDRSNKNASIHLHARKIQLTHPVKKEPLEIVAQPPNEVLWNAFLKNKPAK